MIFGAIPTSRRNSDYLTSPLSHINGLSQQRNRHRREKERHQSYQHGRDSINLISAVSTQGQLRFMLTKGRVTTTVSWIS